MLGWFRSPAAPGDLPPRAAAGKWTDVDLVPACLQRLVGHPSAVGRELAGALGKRRLNERVRLCRLGERDRPDVLCADVSAVDEHVAPIARPVHRLDPLPGSIDNLGLAGSIGTYRGQDELDRLSSAHLGAEKNLRAVRRPNW